MPQIGRSRLAKTIAEQSVLKKHVVVCGVTILARLFSPGHHRQVDRRPGNTASSTRTVIIEAVTSTPVDWPSVL
jgi:hypothetical protein